MAVNMKTQVEMEPPGDTEVPSAWPTSVDTWHEGEIDMDVRTYGCVCSVAEMFYCKHSVTWPLLILSWLPYLYP